MFGLGSLRAPPSVAEGFKTSVLERFDPKWRAKRRLTPVNSPHDRRRLRDFKARFSTYPSGRGWKNAALGGLYPLIDTSWYVNKLVPWKGDFDGETKILARTDHQQAAGRRADRVALGDTVAESCRKAAINIQTYYRWRSRYGGMTLAEARESKRLREENTRLKRAVADLTLDNQILKEAASGNY